MSRDIAYEPSIDENQTRNATERENPGGLIISNYALNKMKAIKINESNEELSWRVALVRSHCMRGRGYTYSVSLEAPNKKEDSLMLQKDGIDVYVPKSDVTRLSGSQIDYVETLQQDGFTVKNPNARSKCPCGHHDIFD